MKLWPAVVILALVQLAGCAHPIKIAPDSEKLATVPDAARIQAKVGYYVTPSLLTTEITTAGGGGDNVRYFPYRDIEAGYLRVLANVFREVAKLDSVDGAKGPSSDVSYVFSPEIVTSSGGAGLFTWPPTSFTVDLTSNVRDKNGQSVATKRVVGSGTAETGERIREHGIAGKRAMEDALDKMQHALTDPAFAKQLGGQLAATPVATSDAPQGNQAQRLQSLDDLRSKGLVTPDEYAIKRKQIIESL
jgi:hypothetical protein